MPATQLHIILSLVLASLSSVPPAATSCRELNSRASEIPPQAESTKSSTASSSSHTSPAALFAAGESALRQGDLQTAEENFRAVVAADPRAGSAYANLGVIAMRRKQWDHALALFQKARQLEPKMSGIQLNIALVEFRRANYAAAIEPLSAFLRDQPDSDQARYLLGLCQIFTEHYADAVDALEPLWPRKSTDVMFLYALDIAAQNAGRRELDEKTLHRMIEVGVDTAEYHLILAKAYLNRQETDKAIAELALASASNPRLPFLHFNSGLAYTRAGDNERAETEFHQDIALEPDLPDNYEQLGLLYLRLQRTEEAEKSFRQALRYDQKRATAHLGLTKLYLQQQKYKQALTEADAALKLAPNSQSGHFMRGQSLMREGRRGEGRQELATAQKLLDTGLDKDRAALGEDRIPNPELTQP
jgi:tetratricopeptide (TPR) repeat protein